MDGFVVYFDSAVPAAVEDNLKALQLDSGAEPFAFFMYAPDEWKRELDSEEIDAISSRLGRQPTAVAAIACRPGPASLAALDGLLRLLTAYPSSLVDDDFGNLWSLGELSAFAATLPVDGLLALRNWPRSSS